MAQEQTAQAQGSGSDLWVAAGVVICLGLGAGMTYWLTSEPAQPPAAQATASPLKGTSMRAKTPETSPAPPPAVASTGDSSAAPGEITHGDTDYASVPFDMLAGYYYVIPDMDKPDAKIKDQIPQPIKDYDGKKVAVRGFMVPVTQERGSVRTFLLVRDQSLCCYGRMPRMNEWVSVQMKDNKPTRFIGDQTVTVFGTIHVGEMIEKGVVLSVYRMDAEEVAGPLDL
jgi:hypothetical protein